MRKKQGRGFVWTPQEEKDLIRLYKKSKMSDLKEYFNRTERAITRKALNLGIKRIIGFVGVNKIWLEEENLYLKKNYATGNLDEIAKYLNRTKKAITERAKVLKLRRDKEVSRLLGCKYSINSSFFSKWNYDMAYVVGLFCADGNMNGSSKTLSIYLHKDDEYLLYQILEKMESEHKVRRDDNVSILAVNNIHMYNDLLKLGIVPNKSKTLKCPDIPLQFIPSFIRGVLDGDGSVDSKRKRMKIVSASKDFAYGVSLLLSKIDINHKIYNEPYKWKGQTTNFYTIRVLRKKDLKKLYDLMYSNISLYLNRKKESFIDMGIEEEDFIVKCK